MSLARSISLFVNFDQGHKRKNLKVRENSVIFYIFPDFRRFFITVQIEKKSEMLREVHLVKTVLFYH